MAISPTTHTNWARTKWSLNVLAARETPRLITSRINDRSSEVTGEPMQTLNIPEVSTLVTYAIGDNGEVTPQTPPGTNQTLTIDQKRECTLVFTDDYKFQIAVKESTQAAMQGRALKDFMEAYVLSLETGLSGTSVRDIAGSLTDAELVLLVQIGVTNNWPSTNRHIMVSAGGMGSILGISEFKDAQFIGDGNLPMTTGKLKAVYGFEPLTSSVVRRRSISAVTRTVNMAWIGKDAGGGAFCKGVQKDVSVKMQEEDLAHKIISWNMFGATLARNDHAYVMRTTAA